MDVIGVAYGAGGVCYASIAGVPPLSSPRQTPGMKPPEQGFIGAADGAGGVGGCPSTLSRATRTG